MQGVRWGSQTGFINEALQSYMGKKRGYQSDESTAWPLAAGEELRITVLLLPSVFIRHLYRGTNYLSVIYGWNLNCQWFLMVFLLLTGMNKFLRQLILLSLMPQCNEKSGGMSLHLV